MLFTSCALFISFLQKDVPLHCEIDYTTLLPEVTAAETSAVVKFEQMEEVKGGVDEDANANNTKPMDVQVSINNDLKVTKSITRALPVVSANTVNGIKEVSYSTDLLYKPYIYIYFYKLTIVGYQN